MHAELAAEQHAGAARPDTMRAALDLPPKDYQLQLRAEVAAAAERRGVEV